MNYLNEMYVRFLTRIKSEKGQTMVEYALLLALIAAVCIAVITGLGTNTNNKLSVINNALK